MRYLLAIAAFASLFGLAHCNDREQDADLKHEPPLFSLLSPDQTNIRFVNKLEEGPATNVMMYEYFYNGGGVAIGDLNNDGLDDIYFSSNMQSNKLYLNKGEMQFEDITEASGVGARNGPWKTGVVMADVNGDKLLDIYVCYSGNLRPERLIGQLFINKGNNKDKVPVFEDMTAAYGLAQPANSTQAVFFDYDKDSDLDLFLLNHNPNTLPPVDDASIAEMLKATDPAAGLRLYRNMLIETRKPSFQDVTAQAGLHMSPLNYGLGVGVADINNDGWQDIYVSNDYIAPDFLYINNGDGTFTDQLRNSIGHVSHFSMGNDIADINNDGLQDIFTLDMLPEDNRRQKLLFAPDNYEKFNLNVKVGFHYQYMRNMLQLNNGDGTFSEIGQLAGISATDWSWASLFADYDNDGWKDLYITNGYLRDYTNQDFVKYMTSYLQQVNRNLTDEEVLELIHKMPASDVVNYMFQNNGDLSFTNRVSDWGVNNPSNSNGASYADLDNDGDLDLVVNNINREAFVYRNEAGERRKHNYVKVKLNGEGANTNGIGARIYLHAGSSKQFVEQMPVRGYQSSVTPLLHFGIGTVDRIDSVIIEWLSGKRQVVVNVKKNELLQLNEANATPYKRVNVSAPTLFEKQKDIDHIVATGNVNDFKRQPLMVNPLSVVGPCMAKGDVNKDGIEDVYIGGANGSAGIIYLQQKSGNFTSRRTAAFESDNKHYDADALFLDANADGNLDLYVVSGGYHNLLPGDPLLQDRLYLGNGRGDFARADKALPFMSASKSCVTSADVNADGYPDLFVGGRNIPGRYPEIPESYLLINDGKGNFINQTLKYSSTLATVGMITDAEFEDINGDKKPDLVVAGDWMPITIFINDGSKFTDQTNTYFDQQRSGWWNSLQFVDVNQDGVKDLVAGNHGLNAQCKVSDKEPAKLYYSDFDNNGSIDPIFIQYVQGRSYPYVSRDELLDQVSLMRTRFPDYKSYADATVDKIFSKEEWDSVRELRANELKTMLFVRNKDNKFVSKQLPVQAQFAPVFVIESADFNSDGFTDLLLCGNIHSARLRFGKTDANHGVVLLNNGKGEFTYVNQKQSGLNLNGDVRGAVVLKDRLLIGVDQQPVMQLKFASK